MNNQVLSSGVAVYGSTLSSSRVHSSSSGGKQCAFASSFQTLEQFQKLKPLCVASSKSVCDLLSSGPTPPPVIPAKLSVPFTINALEYDEASDSDAVLEGGCNRAGILPPNGPDAQNTNDEVCKQFGGCHVSHTKPGEFLVYKFAHSKDFEVDGFVTVDVTVRMASATKKEIKLELLYNGQMEQQANFFTAGLGSGSYTDILWKNVQLRADQRAHAIRVSFVNGNINFCAIGAAYGTGAPVKTPVPTLPPASTPGPTLRTSNPTLPPVSSPTRTPTSGNIKVVVPGQYNAMSFTLDYRDQDTTREGNCPFRKDTPVDAKINGDSVCQQAVSEYTQHCHIGWTQPNEYVVYDFQKQASKASVKVTLRVSSNVKRDIQVDLYASNGGAALATKQIETPGRQSFDAYDTLVVWNSMNIGNGELYKMKVTFLEGGVNLCSFGIE